MPGLGDELRAAREARGLSLSDVSEQIHIRSIYLRSIEEEDWTAIAAPVYVRGFIRTYARYLGLDPQAAVERYNAVAAHEEAPQVRAISTEVRGARGPSPLVLVGTLVAVALVAYVGYSFYQFRTGGTGGPGGNGAVAQVSPGAS